MKFFKKICVSVFILSFIIPLISVHAATFLSYNGQGIWNKESNSSFYNNHHNKIYRVNHYQEKDRFSSTTDSTGLTVKLNKNDWWGSTTIASRTFYGTTSGSFSSQLPTGNFSLYFSSTERAKTFNISGTITD